MTFALLTTSEGAKKMGKTEKGAVWLDPDKTPPYEFFQYWRNIDDADVGSACGCSPSLSVGGDRRKWNGPAISTGTRERLAHELTALVHGRAEADKALEAARALFGGGGTATICPLDHPAGGRLTDGAIPVIELLVRTGLAPSRGEARRLIQQGGVSVDGEKVEDYRRRARIRF